MIKEILTVLSQLSVAYVIFILSYLSNVVLSLYHNISLENMKFDKVKFKNSLLKLGTLIIGSILLLLAIIGLTQCLSSYSDTFNTLGDILPVGAVIITIGNAALQYTREAYDTFQSILLFKPSEELEENLEKEI